MSRQRSARIASRQQQQSRPRTTRRRWLSLAALAANLRRHRETPSVAPVEQGCVPQCGGRPEGNRAQRGPRCSNEHRVQRTRRAHPAQNGFYWRNW